MQECIFCKIIKKEIPSSFIYEDKDFIVFKDVSPKAPVHVLVVLKKHIESLIQIKKGDFNLLGKMMGLVQKVTEQLGLSLDGYKVVINNGKGAGQLVFHLHMHVLGGWRKNPQWQV